MTIFKDVISDHLTSAPHDAMARATHPGMAHFAGSGPKGKSCRECIFWAHKTHDYRSKGGKYRGLIEPATCNKYRQLARNEGSKIPDDAASCKYFEQNDPVPPRYAPAN